MTYSKQTWVDGSGGGTKINATRLAHMEDGIGGVDTIVSGANTTSATAETTSTTAASKTTTANTSSASANTAAALKVQKGTVTAKGDLIVASASGAVTALPVGANGRILTSDPAATHKMKWGISIQVGSTLPGTGSLGDLFFTRTVTALDLTGATETATAGSAAVTTGSTPLSLGVASEADTAGTAKITKTLARTGTTETDTAGTASVSSSAPARTLLFIGKNASANTSEAVVISAINAMTASDGGTWTVTYYNAAGGVPSLTGYDAYALGDGNETDFAGMLNLAKPLLLFAWQSWDSTDTPYSASATFVALTDTDVLDIGTVTGGTTLTTGAGLTGGTNYNMWDGWTMGYDSTGKDADVVISAGTKDSFSGTIITWFHVASGASVGSVVMAARRVGLAADLGSGGTAFTTDGVNMIKASLNWLVGL